MLEDWKRAWRQAVANFHHEMRDSDDADADGTHGRILRRELATARGALAQLDGEIRDAQRQGEAERESASDCARREELARRIQDEETVRIAAEFGARHTRLADVLARKVDVLMAERALLAADIEKMIELVGTPASGSVGTGTAEAGSGRGGGEFEELRRRQRERDAEDRLEQLKRKLDG